MHVMPEQWTNCGSIETKGLQHQHWLTSSGILRYDVSVINNVLNTHRAENLMFVYILLYHITYLVLRKYGPIQMHQFISLCFLIVYGIITYIVHTLAFLRVMTCIFQNGCLESFILVIQFQ